jgi:hypothetical protein
MLQFDYSVRGPGHCECSEAISAKCKRLLRRSFAESILSEAEGLRRKLAMTEYEQ